MKVNIKEILQIKEVIRIHSSNLKETRSGKIRKAIRGWVRILHIHCSSKLCCIILLPPSLPSLPPSLPPNTPSFPPPSLPSLPPSQHSLLPPSLPPFPPSPTLSPQLQNGVLTPGRCWCPCYIRLGFSCRSTCFDIYFITFALATSDFGWLAIAT